MADLFGKVKFGNVIATKKKFSPKKKSSSKLKGKPVINLFKADPNLKIIFDGQEDKVLRKRATATRLAIDRTREELLSNCNRVVKTRRAGFKKQLVKGVNMKRKKLQKKYRREFGKEEDYAANDFGRDADYEGDYSRREDKNTTAKASVVWDDDDDESGLFPDGGGDAAVNGELELKLELDESQSMLNIGQEHEHTGREDSIGDTQVEKEFETAENLANGDEIPASPERPVARDIEEVDLSALLEKDRKEWDEEDHALYNLVYGDRQAVPAEISKYFDVEASDEDEEGNPMPKNKEDEVFEQQFGIVKGLISMEKNVELATDKLDREALHKRMMAQEDAEREAMIQRAFIDGEWRKMRKNNMLDEDDDFDAANPINMLGRDAELGKRPEDFLCDDDELNKDCYDEHGNFLPVWQIKMNRYRRQVNSMNFILSDEEDVTEEELQKRKAVAIKRKFKRQMSNSQLEEVEEFDDHQKDFLRRMRSKRRKIVRSKSESLTVPVPSLCKSSSSDSKGPTHFATADFAAFNQTLANPGSHQPVDAPPLNSQSSFSAMFAQECKKLNEEGFSNHDSQVSSSFASKRYVFSVDQSRSRQAASCQRRALKRSNTEPDQGGRHAKRRRLND